MPNGARRRIEIDGLLQLLPHRFPFLLIDRVVEMEPGVRISALKNVTIDEPFFGERASRTAVMPGLLIIEALAQTGAVLLMVSHEGEGKLVYFASLNNAVWRAEVHPGDQLRLDVTVTQVRGRLSKVHGTASVGDVSVCEADLAAVVVDRESDSGTL